MTRAATPLEYAFELMKLLWRLAAADGQIAPVEQQFIEDRARAGGVPEPMITLIAGKMTAGQAIDPPNMRILAEHPEQTRAAAKALVAADGVLDDDELVALRGLDAALAAYEP
jgi:uncharacterized membrane protein YebE (DUF533 family)